MKERISGRTPSYGFFSRVMYGIGEFFGGGCFVIINSFFAVFLTKALGMPTALAGTIPMVGKIWDAITDPIMGNITDRTSSRFGPKRFYILIGSIASAVTFVLMWLRVSTPSIAVMYVFYIVMYCLFSTGFTIFSVPYSGLLPDMMDDYTMRSKFSNMRMVWSTLGAMVCGIVPTFMIKDNLDPASYLRCALLFGLLFFITSITVFFGTWEKQKEPVRSTMKESFPQAVSVFKNRSFRLFLGLYLFGQCGMDFISGMAVYYVDDVLNAYQNGYFNVPGWSYEDFFFKELLPAVEAKFNCGGSKGRRAVMGLSMGGGGSTVYAQRHPDMFSSCYAMSAWLDNKSDEVGYKKGSYDKLYLVGQAVRKHSALDYLDNADEATLEKLRTVAWFFDCGDDDFLLQQSMDLHMKMRARKVHSELRVRNGVHNWEYWHLALHWALPFASRNFN